VRLLVAAVIAVCATHVAFADPPKPWAAGVSAENQKQALALYDAGNKLFADDNYKDALDQYKAALAFWDHPAIHYNAAVCEFNLGRDVRAYDDVLAAMKFGADAIGASHFKQAQTYEDTLEKRVAELQVRCNLADCDIHLDGAAVVTGATQRVTAGEHEVVATKPRFETKTTNVKAPPIALAPGKPTVLVVELHLLPAERTLVRRWSTWKPWALVAGGAAAGIAGGLLAWHGLSDRDAYDAYYARECTMQACFPSPSRVPPGCTNCSVVPASRQDLLRNGRLEYYAGGGAVIAGVAAIAIGVVMVRGNEPHYESLQVAPVVGADRIGAAISARW
jgi:hypothetical protein